MNSAIRLGSLAALLALLCVPFARAAAAGPAAGGPAPASTDFPTYGLQFVAPADAVLAPFDDVTQIVFYELRGKQAGAAIMVEVDSAKGRSLAEAAKLLAEAIHSQPADATIGGEKAAKFTQLAHVRSYVRRTSVVAVHDGWQYIFHGLDTAGASAAGPLEALLRTVKFKPPEPPSKHLKEFSQHRTAVFDRITLGMPAVARPLKSERNSLSFGIYDFTGHGHVGNPFILRLDHIQLPAPRTFAEVSDAFSKSLQKQLNVPAPFVWTEPREVPGLHVSQPVTATVKEPGGRELVSLERFCMLEVAPGDFVQLLFTFADPSDPRAAAYVEMSDRLLATVKTTPASPSR